MPTFYNQATLSYNNITTTSNIVQGELVEVLSATKTALNAQYSADSTVTYALSIVNAGATNYAGLTLSDNLGAYAFAAGTLVPLDYVAGSITYYVDGALQSAPTVTSTSPLTISGLSVPANGNAMLLYSAQPNAYAPLGAGATITNTASISGGTLSAPITASETIDYTAAPLLSISKSVSPATIVENESVTYTLLIQNTGGAAVTAADNVIVSDTFDPILTLSAVTFNGASWTSPTNYSYNAATGLFASVAGQITVPAATFAQDPTTGIWSVTPGTSTLVITGTV